MAGINMQDESVTVFVVDDDPAIRRSLAWLIESVGLNVETFPSATEVMEKVSPDQAGCLVIDVRMPGPSGLELQQWLKETHIDMPVIIITGHADVPMAVRAMKAGAIDFIEKPFSDQVLLDRIQAALDVERQHREAREEISDIDARLRTLTPRERQVMELVVDGRANKQIAADLNLSEKTVEAHRSHMMTKMCADSLAELVRAVMTVRNHSTVGA